MCIMCYHPNPNAGGDPGLPSKERDPKTEMAYNKGKIQGEKNAAFTLAAELSDMPVEFTEDLVWKWLKAKGAEMVIRNERWQRS
jgi:hypothetical protein